MFRIAHLKRIVIVGLPKAADVDVDLIERAMQVVAQDAEVMPTTPVNDSD